MYFYHMHRHSSPISFWISSPPPCPVPILWSFLPCLINPWRQICASHILMGVAILWSMINLPESQEDVPPLVIIISKERGLKNSLPCHTVDWLDFNYSCCDFKMIPFRSKPLPTLALTLSPPSLLQWFMSLGRGDGTVSFVAEHATNLAVIASINLLFCYYFLFVYMLINARGKLGVWISMC